VSCLKIQAVPGYGVDVGLDKKTIAGLGLKGYLLLRIAPREPDGLFHKNGSTVLCDLKSGESRLLPLAGLPKSAQPLRINIKNSTIYFVGAPESPARRNAIGSFRIGARKPVYLTNNNTNVNYRVPIAPVFTSDERYAFFTVNEPGYDYNGENGWSDSNFACLYRLDLRTGEVNKLTGRIGDLHIDGVSTRKKWLLVRNWKVPYWVSYELYDFEGRHIKTLLPFNFLVPEYGAVAADGSFFVIPMHGVHFGSIEGKDESDKYDKENLYVLKNGGYVNLTRNRFVFSDYCLSPDGKWILIHEFISGSGQDYLTLININTGESKRILKVPKDYILYYFKWQPA
jgi:hypothetical protein